MVYFNEHICKYYYFLKSNWIVILKENEYFFGLISCLVVSSLEFNEHGKGAGDLGEMAEGDQNGTPGGKFCGFSGEHNAGCATHRPLHADLFKRHAAAQALDHGLFGGKPCGDMRSRIGAGEAVGRLALGEDAPDKALGELPKCLANTRDIGQIDAHSNNSSPAGRGQGGHHG